MQDDHGRTMRRWASKRTKSVALSAYTNLHDVTCYTTVVPVSLRPTNFNAEYPSRLSFLEYQDVLSLLFFDPALSRQARSSSLGASTSQQNQGNSRSNYIYRSPLVFVEQDLPLSEDKILL
jgi:hypothetical protein